MEIPLHYYCTDDTAHGTNCVQTYDSYAYLCFELRKIQFSNVQVLRFACALWFLHFIIANTSLELSWNGYISLL